jgi:hypothetical protein
MVVLSSIYLSVFVTMSSHMHSFRGELTIYSCNDSIFYSFIKKSNWLSSITKKGEIESASRPPSGFWMSDDKQLED